MLFREIVGQKEIKKKLIQSVKEGRISHAQLFLGKEGSGNLALAIAYASYVSCLNKKEDDGCGTCSSCVKYQKLIHPDLHFVFPVASTKSVTKDPVSDDFIDKWREAVLINPYMNPGKWYDFIGMENKQGIISKNESGSILRKLSLKTYESDYKIMIIWMPEKMNIVASNKLLKILEEPPSNTIFLLVPESTEYMLPTILSRCQLVKVPRVDNESMTQKLREKYNLEEKILENVVHLANGNYLAAMNLINSGDENDYNFDLFTHLMRITYSRKIPEVIQWVEEVSGIGREKQKSFLSFATRMIRENLVLNINEPGIIFLSNKEKDFSKKFSPFINGNNVLSLYEEFNKAQIHIEANAYNKIVFLDLALKIVKLIKK